jgi:hypothetical protein
LEIQDIFLTIQEFPHEDIPEIFGLHENAGIIYFKQQSK